MATYNLSFSRAGMKVWWAGIFIFSLNQLIEYFVIFVLDKRYIDLCAWDCGWYTSILNDGYDAQPYFNEKEDAANWAFFPLFPIVSSLVQKSLNIQDQVSLIVTGKMLFFLSIISFIKLASAYNITKSPYITGSIVALNPYSIYGNTGYAEPLFLLLSCCFYYLLKTNRLIYSGIVGSLLTATRLVGIFATLSYIISNIKYGKRSLVFKERKDVFFPGLFLIPLGLSIFIIYLYALTGDALAFAHIQRAWGRTLQNPITVLASGIYGSNSEVIFASISIFALILIIVLMIDKKYELAVFSFFATIVPLSTGLVSMPRYIFWQAPLLLIIAQIFDRRYVWFVLPISLSCLIWSYVLWFYQDNIIV